MSQPLPAPPPGPPSSSFGSARATLVAFLTGRLRQRFYADVRDFGDAPDATVQVAAGYICLGSAIAFVASVIGTLTLNPAHIEAHLLGAINAAGAAYGFLQIRRRRDPRQVMHWILFLLLGSIAAITFRHGGIVAPAITTLPVIVAVAALFLRGTHRILALAMCLGVAVFSLLPAFGVIGFPSTYTPGGRTIMGIAMTTLTAVGLGGIAWIANISRDYAIERLTEAHEAIVESAVRSRVALEAAKVGLWDVPDTELRKFHVSESFQSITGYTGEEFNDAFTSLESFVHPEDIVELREAFAVGRKRMSRLRVDFRLKTKSRGYRWFSSRARYSANVDGTIRLSGSLQDINFIKAAEEALRAGRDRAREANKAKSDFIAVMSHEVRTPLNAILGSVEVLRRGHYDHETAELIALIDDAGRGLLAIVNDLLDVSRIEAGRLEVSPAPTDLRLLVTRTAEVWRSQATDKGLSLTVDCEQAAPGAYLLDGGRVRQIVGNLLSNAVKFTDQGSVAISVATFDSSAGPTDIIISVIDTGPGVPDAVAESIFAPFEQAPANSDRGGAGLGLFISRRLARLMGGDLTLEPARRSGSHFRLSLKADRTNETDAAAVETEDAIWTGKRILCVDDNENNRRIAILLLGKFGIDVQGCASGAEALDLCGIEKFDAILMDIVMPDMDGMETLRRLRADPTCPNQSTPAIALTAKLSADDVADYAAAGFDGVAGKPINVREVALAVAPFMVDRQHSANED